MADAVEAMLSQLPPGTDPFTGARSFIDDAVYKDNPTFLTLVKASMAVSALITVMILASFVMKAKQGRLRFVHRDGPLTRLEYRNTGGALWVAFNICEIITGALLLSAYHKKHYTSFLGGFMWASTLLLPWSAQIIHINIIASSAIVRTAFIKASKQKRGSSTLLGILLLAAIQGFFFLAAVFSVLPCIVKLAKTTGLEHTIYLEIHAVIDRAEAKADPTMLAELPPFLAQLEHCVHEFRTAMKIGGSAYIAWLFFFIVAGGIPYYFMDRNMRQKIKFMECELANENELRPQSHHDTPGDSFPGQGDNNPHFPPSTPVLPKDAPFANSLIVRTTSLPEKYQAVIDKDPKFEGLTEKILRLRRMLREDAWEHLLYLSFIISYLPFNFFNVFGVAREDVIRADLIIPVVFLWSWVNFAVPAFFLAVLMLRGAIAYSRSTDLEDSHRGISTGALPQNMTFEIPLNLRNGGGNAASGGGIQMTQMQTMVVDSYGEEKDPNMDLEWKGKHGLSGSV